MFSDFRSLFAFLKLANFSFTHKIIVFVNIPVVCCVHHHCRDQHEKFDIPLLRASLICVTKPQVHRNLSPNRKKREDTEG